MSVNGFEGPQPGPMNRYATTPETAPAQQYGPDQSQYVPPLRSWPPQAPAGQDPAVVYVTRKSVALPWIFVAAGLILWPSALIAGLWALRKARRGNAQMGDGRYIWIAVVGILLGVVMGFLTITTVKDRADQRAQDSIQPHSAPAPAPAP